MNKVNKPIKQAYVYISKLTSGEKEGMEVTVLNKADEPETYWVRDLYKTRSKKFVVTGDMIREHNKLITEEALQAMRDREKQAKSDIVVELGDLGKEE